MSTPNDRNEPLLHYIPDPSKREIKVGQIHGLEIAVQRALQKPLQPLMTVVAVDDADAYLSQQHGKDVVLNGQGEALHIYEYERRKYYRRSDIDAIVFENLEHREEANDKTTENSQRRYEELLEKRYRGIAIESSEDATKIEQALSFISALQRTILEKFYGDQKRDAEVAIEVEKSEVNVHQYRIKAIRTIKEIFTGTYDPGSGKPAKRNDVKSFYDVILETKYTGDTIENAEDARMLDAALAQLSAKQEKLFQKMYGEGKTLSDAAAALGWEYRSAHGLRIRAMRVLRKCFEQRSSLEEDEQKDKGEEAKSKNNKSEEKKAKFTLEQIAAAEPHLTPIQRKIVDLLYKEQKNPAEAIEAVGLSTQYYYLLKKAAETIIEAIANGTYVPPKGRREKEEAPSPGDERDDERTRKFLPPARDETAITPAMLLYHALMRDNIEGKTPDGPTKVEEAMQYLTEMQREILHLCYVRGISARRIEEKFEIKHHQYLREREAAVRIVRDVLEGKYKPEERTKPKPLIPTQQPKRESKYSEEKKVQSAFTLEQIAAAEPHLTPIQRKIVDLLYKEQKNPAEAREAAGVSIAYYYTQKKSAETIIEAVANGTYVPQERAEPKPVIKKTRENKYGDNPIEYYKQHHLGMSRSQLQKDHKGLYNQLTKTGQLKLIPLRRAPQETEEEHEKQKPAKPTRISDKRKDLLDRMAAHRAAKGIREEETVPKLEERFYYTTKEWKTVAELEEALRITYAQPVRYEDLKTKRTLDDLAEIITGDGIIEFLVFGNMFPVAARYAEIIYARAKETGEVWPLHDKRIQKKEADHRAIFVAGYEAYMQAPSEASLVALYKANRRFLRGYVAEVGWYFANRDKERKIKGKDGTEESWNWKDNNWRYRPRWKDAWQHFVPPINRIIKKNVPVPIDSPILASAAFADLLTERETIIALRNNYMKIRTHGETAQGIIIENNKKFSSGATKKFAEWTGMTRSELVSCGEEGQIRALEKYDPTAPNKFQTYAKWWTSSMVFNEYIRRTDITISHSLFEAMMKTQKALKRIQEERRKHIAYEEVMPEIAEKTGYTEKRIREAFETSAKISGMKSLDEKVGDDDKRTYHNFATGDTEGEERELETSIVRKTVQAALATLTPHQRDIVLRYHDEDDATLKEIGKDYGLSRERIRQIKEEGLRKIRDYIETQQQERATKEEERRKGVSPTEYISADDPKTQSSSPPESLSYEHPQGGSRQFRSLLFSLEERCGKKDFTDALARLSPREQDVVDLVYKNGLRRKQVSTRLGIGERTVATHLEHIREKLAPLFASAKAQQPAEPWSLLYAELSQRYHFLPSIGGKTFVTSVLDEFSPEDQRFVALRYERQYSFKTISKREGKNRSTVRAHIERVRKCLHEQIIAAAQEKGIIRGEIHNTKQ